MFTRIVYFICIGFISSIFQLRAQKKYPALASFKIIKPVLEGVTFYEKAGKLGVVDTTGKVITPPIYTNALYFNSGLAAVTKDGKVGFINKSGYEVIAPQFEAAQNFWEGLAVVKIGNKFGYINTQGKVIIKPIFESAYFFSEKLAAVQKDSKWGYIDQQAQNIIPSIYTAATCFEEGWTWVKDNNYHWGAIEKDGSTIGNFDNTDEIVSSSMCGVRHQRFKLKNQLLNSNGQIETLDLIDTSIPPSVSEISNNISQIVAETQNGKEGVVKITTGPNSAVVKKVIIPYKYSRVNIIDGQNLVLVELDKKFGIFDKNGVEILPVSLESLPIIDKIIIGKIGGKSLFFNLQGKRINNNEYDFVGHFLDGLSEVSLNGKWGFVDTLGKEIIPVIHDKNFFYSKFPSLIKAKKNNKVGYYDLKGNLVIPFNYGLYSKDFSEGLASVENSDGLYGYINEKGVHCKLSPSCRIV